MRAVANSVASSRRAVTAARERHACGAKKRRSTPRAGQAARTRAGEPPSPAGYPVDDLRADVRGQV